MSGIRTGNDRKTRRSFETVFNVAQLLKEPTGESREYQFQLEWFALDRDMVARDVEVDVRLIRLADTILAIGEMSGIALIECVRCLEIYDQPFEGAFEQDYQQAVRYHSGLTGFEDEDILPINELHEIDVAEPLRQGIILALPMQPICSPDCPGLLEQDDEDTAGDHRLAILASLLEQVSEEDN